MTVARTSNRLCVALAVSVAALAPAATAAKGPAPIQIQRQGSFAAGGSVLSGADNSTLSCDHGYVSYQVPVKPRKVGLFMWHSSSAHVWENRWDGGEGYQSIFLRKGYPVYLWDGPRVGRGNMGCETYAYVPSLGQDQRNHVAWRFGGAPGEWFAGLQFPIGDAAAYEQAMRARYQEFDIAKNAHLEGETGARAIDRIGPVVVLTNSAGDWRAMLAALSLKTDNIKAIVAYEPAAFVFPDGEGPQGAEGGFGPTHVSLDEFKKLTRFPIQIVWGDFTDKTTWKDTVKISQQFVDSVNKHGGKAEILMLPSVGLKGNSHIPFADLNNAQVAAQLDLFLKKNKLDGR